MLANKLTLLLVSALTAFTLYDVVDRLVPEGSRTSEKQSVEQTKQASLPLLDEEHKTGILALYQEFDVEEQTQNANEAPQQLLFDDRASRIGDHMLTLRSVVVHQDGFALISIVNDKTREQWLEKFHHGDEVFGYTLSIVNQTSVVLRKNDHNFELVMYKKPL